jgi:hypothetical protein
MFLQSLLSKLPLERYMQIVGRWAETNQPGLDPATNSGALPPFQVVVDALETEFCAGQRKSVLTATSDIFKTSLLTIAARLPKDAPLAQVWQEFKTLLRERADIPGATEFDTSTVLSLYLNVLPPGMHTLLRHVRDASGNIRDPSDPVVLENSILNLHDVWLEDVKKHRAGASGSGSHSGQAWKRGNASSPSTVAAASGPADKKRKLGNQASGSGQARAPKLVNEQNYPGLTWKYKGAQVHKCWIQGMTPSKSLALKGKCLLCENAGHDLTRCPEREAAFKADPKRFFCYDRVPVNKP